jgi:hypothetical protein
VSVTVTPPILPPPPRNVQAFVNCDLSVTITWVPNPVGEAVTGYKLYVGTRPNTFDVFDGLEVGTATEFRSGPNREGAVLFIAISAVNAGGAGPRSPELRVAIGAPKPDLLTPADGASFFLPNAPRVRFSWTPLPCPANYRLELTGPNLVFTNPNAPGPDPINGLGGAGGAVENIGGTSHELSFDPNSRPGTYQWRVIGCEPSCRRSIGRNSDARSFTLVPALPAFAAPVDLTPAGVRATGLLPFRLDSRDPTTQRPIQDDLACPSA